MSLITPLFGPSAPQQPPASEAPPPDSGDGAPPVEETSETQDADGAAAGGAGGDTPQDAAPSRPDPALVAAAATPFVALPAVPPDAVAAAITEGEARARLDEAFAPDLDTPDRARRYAEAAAERQAQEALIAAVTPPPENGPSLRGDAAALGDEAGREAPAYDAVA